MKLYQALLFLAYLLLSNYSLAQDIGILHLTPLHLELPFSWKFDGSKRPIEGKGPDGEVVLISVKRMQADEKSGATLSAKEAAKNFAQGAMGQLASKGKQTIVRPVSEFPTIEDKVAYSAGSESSGMFGGKSYFIQYILASTEVIIYLTFEGKGEASPAMQRFDAFLATQRWDE